MIIKQKSSRTQKLYCMIIKRKELKYFKSTTYIVIRYFHVSLLIDGNPCTLISTIYKMLMVAYNSEWKQQNNNVQSKNFALKTLALLLLYDFFFLLLLHHFIVCFPCWNGFFFFIDKISNYIE